MIKSKTVKKSAQQYTGDVVEKTIADQHSNSL